MQCKQAEGLLSEYLDGRLQGESSADLQAHLNACQTCRENMAALRAAVEKVKSLGPAPVPTGLEARISAAVHEKARARGRPAPGLWRILRWTAPAFAILMIGVVSWYLTFQRSAKGPDTLSAYVKRAAESEGVSPPGEIFRTPRGGRGLAGIGTEEAQEAPAAQDFAADVELGDREPADAALAPASGAPAEQPAALEDSAMEAMSEAPVSALPSGVSARIESGEQKARHKSSALLVAPQMPQDTVALQAYTKVGDAGQAEVSFELLAGRETGRIELNAAPLAAAGEKPDKEKTWAMQAPAQSNIALAPIEISKGPAVWRVTLTEEPPLFATEEAGAPARDRLQAGLRQDYRLFVPSSLGTKPADISLDYHRKPAAEALADLGEKTGMVILAAEPLQGEITISLDNVPREVAVDIVASHIRLQNIRRGITNNLAPAPLVEHENP